MPKHFEFFVYIIASETGTLYVGMTKNIFHRTEEHQSGANESFTKKYGCHKLVYYEQHEYVYNAIERENQIKKWRREKKINLIKTMNPGWRDLWLDEMIV
jgi:putative endonuclease